MRASVYAPMVLLISILGAWISWKARHGEIPFYAVPISTLLSSMLWAILVRYAVGQLSTISILYDAGMSLGYLAVFAWMGERLTLLQMTGIALVLLGILMMHIGDAP